MRLWFYISVVMTLILISFRVSAELTNSNIILGEGCRDTPAGCQPKEPYDFIKSSKASDLNLGKKELGPNDPCYFTNTLSTSVLCRKGIVTRTLSYPKLSAIPDYLINQLPGPYDTQTKRKKLGAQLLDPGCDGSFNITLGVDNDGAAGGLLYSALQAAGMSREDTLKYGNGDDYGRTATVYGEIGKCDEKSKVYRSVHFLTEAYTKPTRSTDPNYQYAQNYRNHNLMGYFEKHKRESFTVRWGTGIEQLDGKNGGSPLSATSLQEVYHELGAAVGNYIAPRQNKPDGFGVQTGLFFSLETEKSKRLRNKSYDVIDSRTGKLVKGHVDETVIKIRTKVHMVGGRQAIRNASHFEVDVSAQHTYQRWTQSSAWRWTGGLKGKVNPGGIINSFVHGSVQRATVSKGSSRFHGKVWTVGVECPIVQNVTTMTYEDDECYWQMNLKLNVK